MDKRSILFVSLLTISFFAINTFIFPPEPPSKTPQQEETTVLSTDLPKEEPLLVADADVNETYYVLENDYQQLVFSTQGGALAEINLPFSSKENKKSVVLPISFDKQLEESFPLKPYTVVEGGSTIRKQPVTGGYTPLLRRHVRPKDYALQVLGLTETPRSYRMTSIGPDFIEFRGGSVTKRYYIPSDAPYTLKADIRVDGNPNNLYITSGLLEVELVSGSYSPLLQYYTNKGKLNSWSLPKGEEISLPEANPAWASNANGFFGVILNPTNTGAPGIVLRAVPGEDAPTRLSKIDPKYNLYPAKDYPAYQTLMAYKPTKDPVSLVVYAGPYASDLLKTVDIAMANPETGIGGNPNFTKVVTFQGWFSFISEPFAKFMFLIMQFFHFITRSWGLSLILLTLVLRIMLYPLNTWSYKANTRLQKLGPKLEALKEKYKNDPQRLKTEMAMFYRTERANPMAGCLPMLIQLPFIIGMLDLLKSTFALRGVSFVPGWITNLTAPDVVFSWNYPIFFFGTDFHLLPFILGALMYVQQKLMVAQQKTKGPVTEQQQQMNSISNVMTIAFTFMFYNMPSGLNIYWIFSTLFGLVQQQLMVAKFQKNPKLLQE